MTTHPNRSKQTPKAGRNPRPDEILKAREAAHLTQTEAAELIYCALRGWQDWEGGLRRMHPAFWELWQRKVADLREVGAIAVDRSNIDRLAHSCIDLHGAVAVQKILQDFKASRPKD